MPKHLGTLAAVVVSIAILSIVVWLATRQEDAPADAPAPLDRQVALLEERVAALQASLEVSHLLLAEAYLDAGGFHAMDHALHEGNIDPRDLATVQTTRAAIGALDLPEELREPRDAFMAASAELARALQEQDVAAAAVAAERVHGRQHDLSHAIGAILEPSGPEHDGAGHAEAERADSGPADASPAGDSDGEDAMDALDLPAGVEPFTVALGEDGGPVDGVRTHRIARGSTAALVLRSAVEGELHLHGYDMAWHLGASDVRATFEVPIAGRFPLEFHPGAGDRGIVVAYLEVRP